MLSRCTSWKQWIEKIAACPSSIRMKCAHFLLTERCHLLRTKKSNVLFHCFLNFDPNILGQGSPRPFCISTPFFRAHLPTCPVLIQSLWKSSRKRPTFISYEAHLATLLATLRKSHPKPFIINYHANLLFSPNLQPFPPACFGGNKC